MECCEPTDEPLEGELETRPRLLQSLLSSRCNFVVVLNSSVGGAGLHGSGQDTAVNLTSTTIQSNATKQV